MKYPASVRLERGEVNWILKVGFTTALAANHAPVLLDTILFSFRGRKCLCPEALTVASSTTCLPGCLPGSPGRAWPRAVGGRACRGDEQTTSCHFQPRYGSSRAATCAALRQRSDVGAQAETVKDTCCHVSSLTNQSIASCRVWNLGNSRREKISAPRRSWVDSGHPQTLPASHRAGQTQQLPSCA